MSVVDVVVGGRVQLSVGCLSLLMANRLSCLNLFTRPNGTDRLGVFREKKENDCERTRERTGTGGEEMNVLDVDVPSDSVGCVPRGLHRASFAAQYVFIDLASTTVLRQCTSEFDYEMCC